MKICLEFTHGPIVVPPPEFVSGEIGAQVEFLGVVRELENGRPISGLNYEAHEAMARKTLEKIIIELSTEWPCEFVQVTNRLGFVPVGEASLFIRAQARRRQSALQMTGCLIDRLKADAPIWKSAAKS